MPRRPKKRGPGRPALGDAARSRALQLKVTEAEAEIIRARAEAAGESVSEYARRMLLAR